MAPKPKRSWFDVQMTIMTVSMASALGLWNLFAGPDRETALRKAAEAQASQPEPAAAELPPTPEVPVLNANTAPLPESGEKIILGGVAPQTQVIVQAKRGGGGGGDGGGGGGGGGGAPDTSTGSS
jgi:hypothetical protein